MGSVSRYERRGPLRLPGLSGSSCQRDDEAAKGDEPAADQDGSAGFLMEDQPGDYLRKQQEEEEPGCRRGRAQTQTDECIAGGFQESGENQQQEYDTLSQSSRGYRSRWKLQAAIPPWATPSCKTASHGARPRSSTSTRRRRLRECCRSWWHSGWGRPVPGRPSEMEVPGLGGSCSCACRRPDRAAEDRRPAWNQIPARNSR